MNPLPPNVDELVSAYLDGEAAPDEIATVESDAELMQRVEELRAVSESLAGSVAAPAEATDSLKEAHLSAALGLFDQLVADGEYSADETGEHTESASPHLATVPPAATAPATDSRTVTPDDRERSVVSFEAARERRRPRRFNTGVIAAAVAALLLFVGLAALNLSGSSSDDVASTGLDAARSAADDSSAAAAEMEAAVGDALSDADDAVAGALESSDRALDTAEAPAAEPDPAAGGAAQDSAPAASEPVEEEEAMGDAEEFVEGESANSGDDSATLQLEESDADDEAAADEAADDGGDTADDGGAAELFLGAYDDLDMLVAELERLREGELRDRAGALPPGRFPGCQADVPELAERAELTLVGEALVGDLVVEIHTLESPTSTGRSSGSDVELLVLDPSDCSTIATATPSP